MKPAGIALTASSHNTKNMNNIGEATILVALLLLVLVIKAEMRVVMTVGSQTSSSNNLGEATILVVVMVLLGLVVRVRLHLTVPVASWNSNNAGEAIMLVVFLVLVVRGGMRVKVSVVHHHRNHRYQS